MFARVAPGGARRASPSFFRTITNQFALAAQCLARPAGSDSASPLQSRQSFDQRQQSQPESICHWSAFWFRSGSARSARVWSGQLRNELIARGPLLQRARAELSTSVGTQLGPHSSAAATRERPPRDFRQTC